MATEFKPQDHVIVMERKAKKKDAQGRETWEVTKTEYLPVQWRIFWFRQDNPKGKIDSHALTLDLERGAAIFETYVEREDGGSARMHGSETASDWRDYIEKAQTKSLGRALAAVGYGSQFTDDEFAEGERIVDSPVTKANGQADQALHELGKPGSYEQHEQANGQAEKPAKNEHAEKIGKLLAQVVGNDSKRRIKALREALDIAEGPLPLLEAFTADDAHRVELYVAQQKASAGAGR